MGDDISGPVYIAVYPYSGQREDIVSFSKGQLMLVSERPSDTWWVAELYSGEIGYVPAAYLKEFSRPDENSIITGSPPPIRSPPLRRCSRTMDNKLTTPEAHRWVSGNPIALPRIAQQTWEAVDLTSHDPVASEKKREAMSQLMARVGGYDDCDTVRKPLEQVLLPPLQEDIIQIESRKMSNPVLDSLQHKQLHKELMLRNKRGELRNERSELDKILHVRKRETDYSVRRSENTFHTDDVTPEIIPVTTELYEQLEKRAKHLQKVEEDLSAEKTKPEFLKIKLRKTPT
ncbi:hypothetical protein LOD99_3048 [Oopsacas minuta]|uniref:SH3 domain-containing protein n=1 Tax=Oopsacas minuta TaxID=111878 RepID=A0AAV7K0D9_9METZ|nr:hypothetical protein LOD99_3048 [Oopsacas minuta]